MKKLISIFLVIAIVVGGCKKMNKTQKGAVIGTASGAAAGAVIGKASGNTALGAIIGATVGGVAGAVIGNQMDKQAAEIEEKVPDATVTRVGEGIVVEFQSKVLFDYDKFDLTSASKNSLDKLVIVLNTYPDTDIEVQGHTDSDGSNSYNKKLSEKRAMAVAEYLRDQSVTAERLRIHPFGENSPKYTNATDEGKAQNRRVEFLITANEKMKAEAREQSNR
jgi:outer membrane protein OmpA-like peptidoglycan-associated protein